MMLLRKTARKDPAENERNLLSRELREMREIADLLLDRIDSRMRALEAKEAALDAKIAGIDRLLSRSDLPIPQGGRLRPVLALRERGMSDAEIADALSMPLAEVRLIVNLHGSGLQGKNCPRREKISATAPTPVSVLR